MPVRDKPTAADLGGALLIAGLLGWATGSATLFLIALIALVIAASHAGASRRGLPAVQLPARALACIRPMHGQVVQRFPV